MTRLTLEQAVVVSAYTGFLCCPFSELHKYINRLMGRPVYTHEMGESEIAARIRDLARADFLKIVAEGTP